MVYAAAMRGFLYVNVFFLAVNLVFAGAVYALFSLGQAMAPDLMDSPLLLYPLGLMALAVCLGFAFWTLPVIGRWPPRSRDRAPAPSRRAPSTISARTPLRSVGASKKDTRET